jgi:murein DD-endopeptidase MepM/ murein hydrolase activator NlpD
MARKTPIRDDTAHAWGMRAGIAAFATLAIVVPHVVIAEIERGAARTDRLMMPLGTDGPSNPILPSLREMEREAAAKSPPKPQPSSMPSAAAKASTAVPAGPLQAVSAFAEAPEKPWPRFLDGKGTGSAPIILSAIDTSVLGKGRPGDLPWAPAPAVPPLVTKPERVPDASLARFETPPLRPRMLTAKGGALGVRTPAQHYRISTRAALAVTKPGDPEWISAGRVPARRGTDPIGDPASVIAGMQPKVVAGPAFIMPFENGRVTSLFNQGRRHPAIDLAGRYGSPVYATSHGQTVTFAGSRGGYGNAVITRDREGREHLYGHLSAIYTRPGVTLAQGDRLGALGSTGYSTGPHVHYEVKDRRGAHINPVVLLFPRGVSNGYAWAGTGLVRGATQQAALALPAPPPAPRLAQADARPAPALVRAQVGGQLRQANRAKVRRYRAEQEE